MSRPRKLPADRARRFCVALAADSAERRARPWWTSIHTVARQLGLTYDVALAQAMECAASGLVRHDQSQHTAEDRRAAVQPHSVTLTAAGEALAKKERPVAQLVPFIDAH